MNKQTKIIYQILNIITNLKTESEKEGNFNF